MASTLMDKLSLLMPPTHVQEPKTNPVIEIQHFLPDHVGIVADVFVHALGDEIPADRREFHSALYVFGKLLTADLERRIKAMTEIADRLAAVTPMTPILFASPSPECAPATAPGQASEPPGSI